MGRGERIEIVNPCPLAPSLKRRLRPQGFRKSLNLHFRPNPILVAVSLTLILMAIGPWILWMLIPDAGLFGDPGFLSPSRGMMLFQAASITWFLIILLTGLMTIRKRLNLHSRPNPFRVAVTLTLILMAGGLVIIWIWAYNFPSAVWTDIHWSANLLWSVMTLLGGFVIFVPHETPSEPVKALRRLKCPRCAAIYAYDEQEGIETGFVRCQNCDREFGPTTDKQASQASPEEALQH